MKLKRLRNPVFTQSVIVMLAILATAGAARWHRAHVDQAQAEQLTEEQTKAIAQETLNRYQQTPFRLTTLINHYEAVRDAEGRGPETARIFALGAERLRIHNNRLAQIATKARQSPQPTEFLDKNIRNQEEALRQFLAKNRIIPPGSPIASQYDALLLELELWRRAEQHLLEQTTIQPTPQQPETIQ
jgi:hypothetical protein